MSSAKVRITFDRVGNPVYTVEGVAGMACTDATKFLDRAFGAKDSDRQLTGDALMFETEENLLHEGGM